MDQPVVQQIQVFCETSNDKLVRERWPTHLAVPPQIGHRIRSADGKFGYVVGVTHCGGFNGNGSAYLAVELGDFASAVNSQFK